MATIFGPIGISVKTKMAEIAIPAGESMDTSIRRTHLRKVSSTVFATPLQKESSSDARFQTEDGIWADGLRG